MATLSEWMNRLRYLGRRSRFEDDLDTEVRFHIESRTDELIASGLSPRAAEMAARAEFGSITRSAEDSRAAWQWRWLEDLAADLRYAFRAFGRSPGFAITAVVSLALGIGANAAIFNAIYTVLWKPLPISKPEELVAVSVRFSDGRLRSAPLAFLRQLRRADVFESISVNSVDGLSFSYDDRTERVLGEVVSPNYFDLLGVRPILGEPFTAGVRDGRWAPEAVLSYSFWQRRFGGDPSVIGRTIRLNTYPFTIVGVSPPGFFGLGRGTDYELRLPILPDGREIDQIAEIGARPDRDMGTIARLKPGSSVEVAESAAEAQFQEFSRLTSIRRYQDGARLQIKLAAAGKGDNGVLAQFHTPLFVLLVLAALVLLIACANVANMLLARASARARELAVRTSVGAGRFRLIRQMLAESLLLSLLAGAIAIVIGNWTGGALVHFLPQGHIAMVIDLSLDAHAVLFVFALSLAACVTFGLAPAIHATRGDLAGMLKTDSGASIGDLSRGGLRKALVVSQIAFSLVLLIAAGIFVRTIRNLRPTDYGAHPERVLLFTMKPQQEIYTPAQRRVLIAELVHSVSKVPGVQSAAVAENGPLGSRSASAIVEASGRAPVTADIDWVTPGFFKTIDLPLIAGADLPESDRAGSPSAVINESLARRLFPNENRFSARIRADPHFMRPS
jgi:predicted permease